MRKLLLGLAAGVTFGLFVSQAVGDSNATGDSLQPNARVKLQQSGTDKGLAGTLNFTGATVTRSGNTGTVAITPFSGVTADSPLTGNGTSGSHLGIQTASGAQAGALSASDWSTFSGKAGVASCSAGQYATATATASLTCAQVATSQLSGTVTNAQLASSYSGVGVCSAGQYASTLNANAAPTCSQVQTSQLGGTVTNAQLASSYSGIGACGANTWASTLNSNAAPSCTQPGFSSLSGTATDGQLANAYSGVGSCAANTFATTLGRNAAPTCSQPAPSNLSGASADSVILGSAAPAWTVAAVPSCSAATNGLQYNTGTHAFACNSSINAASLGGATFAAPGAIGGGTPAAGTFTDVTADRLLGRANSVTINPSVAAPTWIAASISNKQYNAFSCAGATCAAINGDGTTGAAFSANGGRTWSASTLPSASAWGQVSCAGATCAVLTLGSTAAAFSANGGSTWSASTLPASKSWNSISCTGANCAATPSDAANTAAAFSSNGGSSWSASTLPTSQQWIAVSCNPAGSTCAAVPSTSGTAAAFSSNGGSSWSASTLPTSQAWLAVSCTTAGNCAALPSTSGTAAAFSSNGGSSWSASTLPASVAWQALSCSGLTCVALKGTSTNTAAFSTNGGSTWSSTTLSATASWVNVACDGKVCLAVQTAAANTVSTISIDGGATWSTASMPSSQTWGQWLACTGGACVTATQSASATAAYLAPTVGGERAQVARATDRNSLAPIDCNGAALVPSVSQVLEGGIFTCGSAQTITLPTAQGAAGIVQGLPGTPAIGDVFQFHVISTASFPFTLAAGAGITLVGNTATANGSATWYCRITSAVASSETITCYGGGGNGPNDANFSAYDSIAGTGSATKISETTATLASTLTADSKLTTRVVGVGAGNLVVRLCSDGTTCGAGNIYLTCTQSCTAAAGVSTACAVTKAAVPAGTVLTWEIGTACATTNPVFNVNAHYTTP